MDDVNSGVGWYEWVESGITRIVYVHESSEIYDPTYGWNPPGFQEASMNGYVHRLIRADEDHNLLVHSCGFCGRSTKVRNE